MLTRKQIFNPHRIDQPKTPRVLDEDAALDCLVYIDQLPPKKQYEFDLEIANSFQAEVKRFHQQEALPTYRPSEYIFNTRAGRIVFSGDQYTQIDLEDGRRIYLAIEHSAAYYFMIKDFQEGIINGDEHLMHIDADGHLDHHTITPLQDSSFLPDINADIEDHFLQIQPFYDEKGVNIGNYLTAVRHQFPNIKVTYLYGYHKESFIYQPPDVSSFDAASRILRWQIPEEYLDIGLISSIDIDVFADIIGDDLDELEEATMQKIVSIGKKSKVVHVILSPSFMTPNRVGGELIGTLLEKLIDD